MPHLQQLNSKTPLDLETRILKAAAIILLILAVAKLVITDLHELIALIGRFQ